MKPWKSKHRPSTESEQVHKIPKMKQKKKTNYKSYVFKIRNMLKMTSASAFGRAFLLFNNKIKIITNITETKKLKI